MVTAGPSPAHQAGVRETPPFSSPFLPTNHPQICVGGASVLVLPWAVRGIAEKLMFPACQAHAGFPLCLRPGPRCGELGCWDGPLQLKREDASIR